MKTRNKALLSLFAVIILAIAAGVYYFASNLDALVKAAIEKYGSQATHTPVRVDRVKITLLQGEGTIRGLSVANPPGFSAAPAFSLGEILTRINTKALTDKKIVIDEVRIIAPVVVYEMNAERQSNLLLLKENLTAGGAPSAPQEHNTEVKPITLVIQHLLLQDAKLHATIVPLNNRQLELSLPALELNNLVGTPAQITRQVLSRVIEQAKTAVQQSAVGQEMEKLKTDVKEKIDAKKDEIKARAVDKLEEQKHKAKEKLKGFLGQ
ncbi:MAG: hypothetical protein HY080_10710 [Gammaproteobacteria bacterium]|nr:hypothetical protein [Gammaproteobacteria bacterium]